MILNLGLRLYTLFCTLSAPLHSLRLSVHLCCYHTRMHFRQLNFVEWIILLLLMTRKKSLKTIDTIEKWRLEIFHLRRMFFKGMIK